MDEPYIRTDDAKTIIDRILINGNDFFSTQDLSSGMHRKCA